MKPINILPVVIVLANGFGYVGWRAHGHINDFFGFSALASILVCLAMAGRGFMKGRVPRDTAALYAFTLFFLGPFINIVPRWGDLYECAAAVAVGLEGLLGVVLLSLHLREEAVEKDRST